MWGEVLRTTNTNVEHSKSSDQYEVSPAYASSCQDLGGHGSGYHANYIGSKARESDVWLDMHSRTTRKHMANDSRKATK